MSHDVYKALHVKFHFVISSIIHIFNVQYEGITFMYM